MGRFQIGTLEAVLNAHWGDVFHKAKSLSFDGVELGVYAQNYRESEIWLEGGWEDLRERSESVAMPILSVCLHTFWTYTFADPNVANRTTAKQIALQTIWACKYLGARTILIPVTNPLQLDPEDAAQRWTDETRAIADEAARYGIHLALENVGRSHMVTGEETLALLDAIDHPSVGAYFDVGNAKMLGSDPIADIQTLKGRIKQVHIKDPRKDRTSCYIGEGEVDLTGCLNALIEADYSGPLVFETPTLNDPMQTAAQNLKTLQSMIDSTS